MLVSSAFADSVTLKSGEHIEGKVTKESDKEVTIEIASGGIVDERVVPRAQIDKIDKVSPEVLAYQKVMEIQVGQNSFAAVQYDPAIAALEGFVTEYPKSTHTADAQKVLDALQAEKKRVEKGDVKLNGRWLTKAEVEKEKVQIDGRLAYNYMVSQSTAGDLVGALNTFVIMEKNFPGAAVMPDAVELALKLIPAVEQQVEAAIPAQKVYMTEHEKGFAAANPTDRAVMVAAFKKEQAGADAAATAADSGNQWAPFLSHNAKCLTSLRTRGAKEFPRLTKLQPEKMRESVKLAASGQQKMASGDLAGAKADFKAATTLWAANELAVRLDKEATAEAKTSSSAAAATPVATPTPATPKPKPATPKARHNTPLPAPSAQAGAPKTSQIESEDKPFYLTVTGAVTIVGGVAVVLAGSNIFLKMRKRKAEQAEQAEIR
jgi:hypothetical protein